MCKATLEDHREHIKSERLTCNRETAKAPFLLQGLGLPDGGILANDNGVVDEAIFKPLDLPDHLCLGVGGAVVVNDPQPTLQGHMNCHFMFCDSVHRRRNEGRLQGNVPGDWRFKRDFGGRETNVARHNEKVIVR